MLLAFHKPCGVLSQFTREQPGRRTLANFGFPKHVYPIGRLDADTEGLLLLSDEPEFNERLLHPRHAHEREYWAQVERIPTSESLKKLERGVLIQGRKTLPCRAWLLDPQPQVVGCVTPCALDLNQPTPVPSQEGNKPPDARKQFPSGEGSGAGSRAQGMIQLPPRDPPIRFRKNVPDCWIGLALIEGKNRQVRHMTAAIGHPTLRLIRVRIGGFPLADLPAGTWKELIRAERQTVLQ